MAIYQEIAAVLEAEIKQNYNAGELLPSETQLAGRFSVNRHTVRHAIDELVKEGLILRKQGKGNIVQAPISRYLLRKKADFTGNLVVESNSINSEVVKSSVILASASIAEALNVEAGKKIVHIQTVRVLSDRPISIIDHYLDQEEWWFRFKYFSKGSLHKFIESELDLQVTRKSTQLRAVMPTRAEVKLLQMEEGNIPLVKMKTINVVKNSDRVMEYSISVTRSDLVELVMEH